MAVLRRQPEADQALKRWIGEGEQIEMSSVAWSEFLCGPVSAEQLHRARAFVSHVEPFTISDAALAAELFNVTGRRSRTPGNCMIAASAIRRDSAVATFDRSGFARFTAFQLRLVPL